MIKPLAKITVLLSILVIAQLFSTAHAQQTSCESGAPISQTFENGARWDMCWESRVRENLVLSNVQYTPPDGTASKVLDEARLSQLHVAYDDSDVTYNDITQFGLGGSYLVELTSQDCPLGELLISQTRAAACKWLANGSDNFRMRNRASSAHSLNLYSVSQVGSYAYITSWLFYDDGAIEPQVGASGALQRSSSSLTLPFGRILQGDDDTLWLSHTHNYYWHLDFDLGDSATDDVVAESRYPFDEDGVRYQESERFTVEAARQINPELATTWHILDAPAPDQSINESVGYLIEPLRYGHRLVREDTEPYTEFDFFITKANDCERFASQNARFNPDCLNNVLQYTNGESLENEDLVVWHRVSFHHVPRSEDQRHMHTHWDGFLIEPSNVHSFSPGLSGQPNQAPQIAHIEDQQHRRGEQVSWHAHASDADQDSLTFSATGLPPGVEVDNTGTFSGAPNSDGVFDVVIRVSDSLSSSEQAFTWTIARAESRGIGYTGAVFLGLLLMFGLVRHYQIHSTGPLHQCKRCRRR